MSNLTRLTSQAIGAFGEKAVETELLRRGWIPANANATVVQLQEGKMRTDFLRETGTSAGADLERAWAYVGRFLWGFAIVEAEVDEIFVRLFNFNASASLMFIPNLDMRKKLKLIEVGLKNQRIDELGNILKRLHALADIRNVVAHFSFGPQISVDGIYFDYVNRDGEMRLPNVRKADTEEADTTITYAQLDHFDCEARELFDALQGLHGALSPVADVGAELARDIAQIVAASETSFYFQ